MKTEIARSLCKTCRLVEVVHGDGKTAMTWYVVEVKISHRWKSIMMDRSRAAAVRRFETCDVRQEKVAEHNERVIENLIQKGVSWLRPVRR